MKGGDEKSMADSKKRGRGWHGDSARHAAAGRKGGRQRGKNARKRKTLETETEGMTMM